MSENRRRLTAMQLAEWLEQFVFSAAQGVRAETADILDRCLEAGTCDELETLVTRIVMQPATRVDMLSEMVEVIEGRMSELRQTHFAHCEILTRALSVLWEIELPAAAVRDLVNGASDSDLSAIMATLTDDDDDLDDDDHPANQLAELAMLDADLHLILDAHEFVIDWQLAMEMVAFRAAWDQRGGELALLGDGFGRTH
ncbi:MAG: hypothetical protein SGJ24_07940 [Chloroflexota bacterium]|nr:hypothetical protein [Chloroflexota bacterium]